MKPWLTLLIFSGCAHYRAIDPPSLICIEPSENTLDITLTVSGGESLNHEFSCTADRFEDEIVLSAIRSYDVKGFLSEQMYRSFTTSCSLQRPPDDHYTLIYGDSSMAVQIDGDAITERSTGQDLTCSVDAPLPSDQEESP